MGNHNSSSDDIIKANSEKIIKAKVKIDLAIKRTLHRYKTAQTDNGVTIGDDEKNDLKARYESFYKVK